MRRYKHILAVALGATFAVLAAVTPAVATFGDSTYLYWRDVKLLPGNVSSPASESPHGGYMSATVKCAVCHSVHAAAPSGEALLKTTLGSDRANACIYCHVSASLSSSTTVYQGLQSNYTTDSITNHGVDAAKFADATCPRCHQVHGATTRIPLHWYLQKKLLKGMQVQDEMNPSYDDDFSFAPVGTDLPEMAVTKWCTGCHQGKNGYSYYSQHYDEDTHINRAPSTTYTVNGAVTTIAWASSAYCSSCHSNSRGTNDWPHNTPGAARFLDSALSAADATSGAGSNPNVDGVCLKCHKSGVAGPGVGESF